MSVNNFYSYHQNGDTLFQIVHNLGGDTLNNFQANLVKSSKMNYFLIENGNIIEYNIDSGLKITYHYDSMARVILSKISDSIHHTYEYEGISQKLKSSFLIQDSDTLMIEKYINGVLNFNFSKENFIDTLYVYKIQYSIQEIQ